MLELYECVIFVNHNCILKLFIQTVQSRDIKLFCRSVMDPEINNEGSGTDDGS